MSAGGGERFSTGATARTATRYTLKVDIGGLSGVLAPLLGKQPPDSHVWILGGEAPAFVKSEQALYLGGPVWRIDSCEPLVAANFRGQTLIVSNTACVLPRRAEFARSQRLRYYVETSFCVSNSCLPFAFGSLSSQSCSADSVR